MKEKREFQWLRSVKENSSVVIKSIVFFVLSYFVIEKGFYILEPYATGDGFEYVAMTEALYNHASPDIRATDLQTFKNDYSSVSSWGRNLKADLFDESEARLRDTAYHHFMREVTGCFVALNGKRYSYHFFFYSLLNVPARWAMTTFHQVPLKCFQGTNAILIVLTTFVLLFYRPLETWRASLLAISFVYSAAFWYIGWTHAEVYTICLVTLSLWMSFRDRPYLAILFASLASLQNQPLILLVLLLDAKAFFEGEKSILRLVKISLASVIIVWPSVFYFYHYRIPNLVSHQGFLSNDYITFTRVIGFFTDLNQGAVLAIPVALFLFVFLWIRILYLDLSRKKKIQWLDLLPFVILAITISVCTMGNWNHGQAVVNRYASWVSVMILVVTFIWLTESKFSIRIQYVLMGLIALSQYLAISYFEKDNKYDWMAGVPKAPAIWVMDHYPAFYNPDPMIFMGRIFGGYNVAANKEPLIYYSEERKLRKIMVHEERLDSLAQIGFSAQDIHEYKEHMNFINGWGYINDPEKHLSVAEQQKLIEQTREKLIQNMILTIKANHTMFESIKAKVNDYGAPMDSLLRNTAIYLIDRKSGE